MAAARVIAVVVASDDPLARAGLMRLLGDDADLDVREELLPHLDARELDALDPDVVVVDAATELPALPPSAPALVLAPDAASGVEALAGGARGALLRDASADALRAATRAVAAGAVVIDDAVLAALLAGRRAVAEPAETLTARELDVLALLVEGLSNKRIAARLGISEHTAKFHVNAILAKLEADTRTEAVVRAARLGLVML